MPFFAFADAAYAGCRLLIADTLHAYAIQQIYAAEGVLYGTLRFFITTPARLPCCRRVSAIISPDAALLLPPCHADVI